MEKVKWILLIVVFIVSCTETKEVSNFKEIASNHKIVALLPANATFILSNDDKNKIPQEQIDESGVKLSFMIQTEMNKWFEKNKNNYRITLLDIKKTNEILFSKGMSFGQFKELSKDTFAKMLDVDAVILCNVNLSKRYTDDDYNALLIVDGVGAPILGSKFKVVTQIGIVEKTSHTILWQK